jgi:arylsulfatase
VVPYSASLANSSAAAEKPKVLLILADDLGYPDIGGYGSEVRKPNLDAAPSSLSRSWGLAFP